MEKLTLPQELLIIVMPGNISMMATEFIILGFENLKKLGSLMFLMFGSVYLTTTFGNSLFMILMCPQRGLQKTMYLFLANIVCLEVC